MEPKWGRNGTEMGVEIHQKPEKGAEGEPKKAFPKVCRERSPKAGNPEQKPATRSKSRQSGATRRNVGGQLY